MPFLGSRIKKYAAAAIKEKLRQRKKASDD